MTGSQKERIRSLVRAAEDASALMREVANELYELIESSDSPVDG